MIMIDYHFKYQFYDMRKIIGLNVLISDFFAFFILLETSTLVIKEEVFYKYLIYN